MYRVRLNCPFTLNSQLDDLVDDVSSVYLERCPEIKAFDSFEAGVKSAGHSHYMGMMWSNGESKLDPQHLVVRGSTSLTNNSLVTLDVSNVLQEMSFFPGQIVAFKAKPHEESRRHVLVVSEFVDPMSAIKPRPEPFVQGKTERIVIAAGPFTKATDSMVELNYLSLIELLHHCKRVNPTSLILVGPFVLPFNDDSKLLETSINTTKELHERFLRYIRNELKDSQCCVYMIPSPNELTDSQVSTYIYPTNVMKINPDRKSKLKIECLSDPAIFKIGNIIIQATSVDTLFHLSQSELTINRETKDRMGYLSKHLLTQNSVFPVYPTISKRDDTLGLKDHLNIEYCNLLREAHHRLVPHIIIVPSRFAPFVKKVHGCLIVNPSACARKNCVQIDVEAKEYNSEMFADSVEASVVKCRTPAPETTSEPSTQEAVPSPPIPTSSPPVPLSTPPVSSSTPPDFTAMDANADLSHVSEV